MSQLLPLPAAWEETLRTVQAFAPSAVIAGGALRDLAWGGQVKDLDIFVSGQEVGYAPIRTPSGWVQKMILAAAGYRCGLREEVSAVQEFVVPGLDIPVQVIVLNLGPLSTQDFKLAVIERMDFAACQVCHNGNVGTYTPRFVLDRDARSMTLMRCEDETQARRSLKRARRFAEKYPDATFDMTLAERFIGVWSPEIDSIENTSAPVWA